MAEKSVDIRRLRALASGRKNGAAKYPKGVMSQIRRSQAERSENMDLLYACLNDWSQLDGKRRDHERFMRYMGGDQWSDLVADPDNAGKMIREEVLISRTGITPISLNIMQEFIRNILGQMLSNKYQSVVRARRSEDDVVAEMLTNTLQVSGTERKSDARHQSPVLPVVDGHIVGKGDIYSVG
jgi:hypothetical protein